MEVAKKSKELLNIIKVAMLVVTSMVGAGFASGKEIAVYFARFGYAAYPAAVLCGMLFFAAVAAVARSAERIRPDSIEDYNKALFGRAGAVADILTLFNFLIVAAAMIAAVDSLFVFFGWATPVFSLITALLCFVAVLGGTRGLLNIGLVLTPVMIIIIIVVGAGGMLSLNYLGDVGYLSAPHKLIGNVISYVSFNTLLASGVMIKVRLPYKSYLKGIGLGSAIVTVLMLIVIGAVMSGGLTALNADMPMMILAGAINTSVLAGVIIWLGVFTSMAAAVLPVADWATGFIKNKAIAAAVVVTAAYIGSRLGFRQIVEFVFPVSGVFGIIFVMAAALYCKKTEAAHLGGGVKGGAKGGAKGVIVR